jgi:GTP-binding protein HflX
MRTVPVRNIRPATLIGTGHVDDIAAAIQLEKVSLAIVDSALSPIQQRNLETAWQCKVIDRTALILEIFGERAATAEGRLQVELAHLDYQAGRLVRSWTHLERQRGGFGFLGGPGETQIEADRRLIRNRMARIRKQLDEVRRTRSLHRQRRQRAPWPIVALVGYTNAGKSTLFNRLTASDVMAENLLFATLDPTMRRILVPGIGTTILSDTVGFVSALPTQLVAAFRATLEEVQAADLLLHVRDISHEDSEAQRSDVLDVLGELGIAEGSGPPIIEVWNKMDALGSDARAQAERRSQREGAVCISALTGAGIAMLEASLVNALGGAAIRRTVNVDVSDGAKQAWIHRHAQIISQRIDGQFVCYEITLAASDSARYDQL